MITGATGVMGYATLLEFQPRLERFNLRLLVRNSKKNRKKLKWTSGYPQIEIIWGDLCNPDDVSRALGDSDIVLHMGGMVSPAADYYPEKTLKVNVEAAHNIVNAIKSQQGKEAALVYIGSVAQLSNRAEPLHWGRAGDPLMASEYDYYGISKILAEREVCESGLKRWVSLRQSGILHPGLLTKASDPISFHVPLRGVLEWATVEDSARLMANICESDIPESFWRKFYNIGSGKNFRISNYRFMQLLMDAIGCPPPEKVFETGWFANRNFHGMWYSDSDELENIAHFREDISAEDYFRRMASGLPFYFKLARIAPAWPIKMFMKRVAHTKDYGTLYWLSHKECESKVRAYFGSREIQASTPGWEEYDLSEPSEKGIRLNHGYDETKSLEELNIEDMRQAAGFRGGKCISGNMPQGDIDTPLEWECGFGHRFRMTPRSVILGGHWCGECMPAPWRYEEEAKLNKFISQVMNR